MQGIGHVPSLQMIIHVYNLVNQNLPSMLISVKFKHSWQIARK